MKNTIIQGDCLEVMKQLEDESVDAVITDPPYHLTSIVKRFGKKNSALAKFGTDGVYVRASKGFMGKEWDGGDIAYNVDMWKECLRVLKSGGHLLSFGGTRTYHRMACAIEDAGFEIRDMIEWIYASGFPKSLAIDKMIAKKQGAEKQGAGSKGNTFLLSNEYQNYELTKTAKMWNGYGTALKPAHEPICLARKPLSEKSIVDNVLKHGTGGINIDGCRIPYESEEDRNSMDIRHYTKEDCFQNKEPKKSKFQIKSSNIQGRFPANIICQDDALNDGRITKDAGIGGRGKHSRGDGYGFEPTGQEDIEKPTGGGSNSRYFDIDIWHRKHGLLQYPKASKSEKNLGLDKLVIIDIMKVLNNNITLCEKNLTQEVKLVRLLVSMETSQIKVIAESGTGNKSVLEWSIEWFGKNLMEKYQKECKSTILTKTQSITTSGIYSWLMHLLTKEYTADVNLKMENGISPVVNVEKSKELIITISEKLAFRLGVKNAVLPTQLKISVKEGNCFHPTCKPLSLMQYLITLVSKKDDIVLDPFAGSGTTLVAAKSLGRKYIGIELTEEYIPTIEARLRATQKPLL